MNMKELKVKIDEWKVKIVKSEIETENTNGGEGLQIGKEYKNPKGSQKPKGSQIEKKNIWSLQKLKSQM